MLLICYPRCSTCKKAQNYLDNKKITYQYRDIKIDNPKKEELERWLKLTNKDIKAFYNTSGLIYRNNNLKDKIKDMSIDEQLDLLASDGMLVKRPLLILEDKVLIGFKEKEWEEYLK